MRLEKGLFQQIIMALKAMPKHFSPKFPECIFCHIPCRKGNGMLGLCMRCIKSIPWITKVECATCGRYEGCRDCVRRENTYLTMNRSAVQYSTEMREWLARYKYRGDESLLALFIEMVRYPYQALGQLLAKSGGKFDFITYIPLSMERYAERGFNQAEQLACGIAKAYGLPVMPILNRTLHTGKQSYKTREQRLNDLQYVFSYVGSLAIRFDKDQTLNILLVDDVYTTGSTLNQAASVIREHLNAHVYGLTWAR